MWGCIHTRSYHNIMRGSQKMDMHSPIGLVKQPTNVVFQCLALTTFADTRGLQDIIDRHANRV